MLPLLLAFVVKRKYVVVVVALVGFVNLLLLPFIVVADK